MFDDERFEGILLADGFEEALIGIGEQFSKRFAVYDRELCIGILMSRDGMDREGADEFFEYNVAGAWVGEATPCFMDRIAPE